MSCLLPYGPPRITEPEEILTAARRCLHARPRPYTVIHVATENHTYEGYQVLGIRTDHTGSSDRVFLQIGEARSFGSSEVFHTVATLELTTLGWFQDLN